MQHREPRGAAGAAGRPVDLPGADGNRVPAVGDPVPVLDGPCELAKREVRPLGLLGVPEPELLVRRAGDADPGLREVPCLVGNEREAERGRWRVHDDEAVAAVGGIHHEGPQPLYLEGRAEPAGEGGDVPDPHSLHLAVAAGGDRLDQPARRLEDDARLRLLHREDPGLEQHRRDAKAVGAGHGRGVGGLHDHEAHLRRRVHRRHEQVHVTEDAAPRLVEDHVAEPPVLGDEAALLPEGRAGGRRDPADDDVPHLALGVAAHYVDDVARAHRSRRPPTATAAAYGHHPFPP